MKLLLSIVVIASHCKINYGNMRPLYEAIAGCVVPFFFMVNGFLLYKEENLCDRIKIRLKKIIKLYLIWNLIYFPISIYGYVNNNFSLIEAIIRYIRGFFLIGEHFYSWPLWYLLSMIYSYIGLMILEKLKLSDLKKFLITFSIYLFAVVMNYLLDNNFNNIFITIFKHTFSNPRLFTGIFLVELGLLIKKYNIKFSKKILLPFIIIMFLISVFFPNPLSNLFLYISVFLCALEFNNIKFDTVNLRKCSTIFYFIHMLNLFVILLIVGEAKAKGWLVFFITLIACIIESIIIIYIQKKKDSKILKELFS